MARTQPAAARVNGMPALDSLDADVREEVRRHGVDPQTDVDAVRRFAQTAVRDHDQRSLSGVVRPVEDPDRAVDELVARVAGFGPLQRYLDDPTVEEVWINEPQRVFVARDGRHELTTTILTAAEVRDLVERMLKTSGRRVDVSTPFVDAMLPSGHRLHVVLDGITRGYSAVNVRKFVIKASRLHHLVELGTLTPQAADFLEAASSPASTSSSPAAPRRARPRSSTLWAPPSPDATGSSPRRRSTSCASIIRTGWRCRPDRPGSEGTGEITLRHLVKESLRMRPSRIIVGEVRAEECLDLLLALNSGLPGMATVHANSAREALVKLCTLPLLAGENISARFVVPTVAASVDLVVHLGFDAGGKRRVREIVAVPGRVEADIIETEPIFITQGGRLTRAQGMPPRLERFEIAGIDIHALLAHEPAVPTATVR